MTDTQEAMRKEFEQQFPIAEKIHWDIDQKSYRPNNPFDSAQVYAAAYRNMKLEGWQAATAQSAEKIARLEAAVLNQMIFRAAAELSNKQLRDGLNECRTALLGVPNFVPTSHSDKVDEAIKDVDNILAQQPSTEALDAYVAKGKSIEKDAVEWVVNDNAELGVKIGNQFFFLYKGDSLVYEDAKHDDGTQMNWRHVFKREFGECCHPVNYADPAKWGTVSLNDSDEWMPLPPAPKE